MITSGRTTSDIKVSKSIGNVAYTNLFVISGVINALTTNWQLVSPLPLIADLPHQQLTTPSTVFVASTSNDDTGTGIGARLVIVNGLDINFNPLEEFVILNGQTPVETTNIFSNISEVTIFQFGTNIDIVTGDSIAVGDIYVGTGTFASGIPANPITGIALSQNNPNSRDGIFTVPDGKILLLKSLFCGTEPDKKENISLIVQIGIKFFGLGENQWFKSEPYTFDGSFQYLPEFNLPIPPRTQIQIRARTTTDKSKNSTISLGVELQDLRG